MGYKRGPIIAYKDQEELERILHPPEDDLINKKKNQSRKPTDKQVRLKALREIEQFIKMVVSYKS